MKHAALRIGLSLLAGIVLAFVFACPPPPKPDIDPNNAEFFIDVPANAASEDTVGESVTFQISQTMPGWLDSVVVVVTNRSDDRVDTTIRLAGPFDEAMTFTIVFGTPGTKALDATAYFREGVEKTDQVIFLVIALPDTAPPAIAITAPADSDTVHVAATPVTVSGTASDESGVSAVTYLTIRGSQRDSGDAEGTTSWSVDSLDIDTGATKIIVTATDSAGNVAADTVVVVYVLPPDTTPPVVAITAPADSDTVHVACTPLSLSGAAQDESGISAVTYLTIHGTLRDSGDAEGTTSWSVDSLDLDTGATKIIVRAVDSADNRGADTIVVIYVDTTSTVAPDQDSTPPVVTITAPADSDTVHISAVPVTVSGTAADDSGIARVEYSLLVGTSNNSPAVQGKTTWSIAGLQLRAGTAVIEVRATDSAGNVGADTIAIVYDTTTAPQPPVITSQPGDMQTVINGPVTFAVVATGTKPLTYAWKRGTTALTGSDSTYRIAMAQFTDSGTYTCIVTDANGLSDTTTPWRLQVLASSVPPSITTQPASDTVSEGDSVTLSVTASGTSLIYQWYKDGDSIPGATTRVFHIDTAEFSDSGSYTVKVCNAQKCTTSAAAHLTVQTGSFGITVTAGAHGSITPAGTAGVVAVARGANQVFTITPATGYHIDTVRVDDTVNVAAKNAGSFTFSNVTANHMISAVFAINTYTLTVTSLHGTVTTNPSTSGPVNHGTQVTLHATPTAGYYFTGWSGGVTSSDTPLVVTMVSDSAITANFAAIGRFTINETSTHGTVTFSPDSSDYLKGTKVKLTAAPDPGYDFVQWSGDASGTKDTVTITVDTTKNVTAVFAIKTYPLTVTAGTGGSIAAPAMSPDTVDHGVATTIIARPAAGYVFEKWTRSSGTCTIADSTNDTTTVTLTNGAAAVTANFVLKKFRLTIAAANGTVAATPTVTDMDYDSGTVVGLKATPSSANYRFVSWTGVGSSTGDSATVTMTSAKTVTATFIRQYTLTLTTIGNGTISGATSGDKIDSATIVTLTAVRANANYRVQWSGDTLEAGSDSIATALMTANRSVTARFVRQYMLTVVGDGDHGTVTPASGLVDSNSVVTLGVGSKQSMYEFDYWALSPTNAGVLSYASIEDGATVKLTAGDGTVTAYFIHLQPAAITTNPSAPDSSHIGSSVTLRVKATGNPAPTYQWYKDGDAITGATDTVLVLSNIQKGDSGSYRARATVSYGAYLSVDSSNVAVVNVTYVKSMSLGYSHSLFMKNNGTIWACGLNSDGQLGDNTTNTAYMPVQVTSMAGATAYCAGGSRSYFIKGGIVYACGANASGDLGMGDSAVYLEPTRNTKLSGLFVRIADGAAVTSAGALWMWGSNGAGQLGIGNYESQAAPVGPGAPENIASACTNPGTSDAHTLLISVSGLVYGAGSNVLGQLGDSTLIDRLQFTSMKRVSSVSSVAVGQYHSWMLTSGGDLYGCGKGEASSSSTINDSLPVFFRSGVKAVAAYQRHSMIVFNDGSLWGCGLNTYGQLGTTVALGTTTSALVQAEIDVSSVGVAAVAVGYRHTFILKEDGTLWACGLNGSGQLGDGTTSNASVPKRIY